MTYGPSSRLLVAFLLMFAAVIIVSGTSEAEDRLVIGEYFSRSDCPDCHKANVRLSNIYTERGFDFAYVTLIIDKNDLADERMDRYHPFERSYPTVEFDGGYLEEVGIATQPEYESDIEYSEERDLPEIEMELEMHPAGDGKIRVKVRLFLDEEQDPFGVNVIAYVVEPVSRYLDTSNDNYGYGFLDMAIDADTRLQPGEWWLNETVWVGADHTDKNGDNFSDIQYENVNIVCAVFANESGNPRYTVQGMIATPPEIEVITPPGNVIGQLELALNASGNEIRNRSIELVQYRVDEGAWVAINGSDGHYSTIWNSTDVQNGTHEIEFRVEDDTGTTTRETITVNVSNTDFDPPSLKYRGPEGPSINGTVIFIANASDDNDIVVTLMIDDFATITMPGNGSYTTDVNTTGLSEGLHTFTISASDGAFTVHRHRVLVVDNEPDPWIGTVMVVRDVQDHPWPKDGNVSGNITFRMYGYDNEVIANVSISVDGKMFYGYVESHSEENGTFDSVLNVSVDTSTVPDGGYSFDAEIVDSVGQVVEHPLFFHSIDNTPPSAITPDLEWDHGWHLEWGSPPEFDVIGFQVEILDMDREPIIDGNHSFWTNDTEITITGHPYTSYFSLRAVDDAGNLGIRVPIEVMDLPTIAVDIEVGKSSEEVRTVLVTVSCNGDYTAKGLYLLVQMGNDTLYDNDIEDLGPESTRTYTFEWNITKDVIGNATVTFEGYDITSSTPVKVGSEDKDDDFDPIPPVVVGAMVVVFAALLVLALRIIGFDKRTRWK